MIDTKHDAVSQQVKEVDGDIAVPADMTSVIQRGLLFARVFYLLSYGANAFLMPFLVLYYNRLGFSGGEIGFLKGIAPLITMVGAPLWGAVADATRRHKVVWFVAMAASWLSVLLLAMTSAYPVLIAIVVARALFGAPITTLADSAVIELLGERHERYSLQRLWGAVGWGAFGFLGGVAVDRFGLSWAFGGHLLLFAACFVAVAGVPVAGATMASTAHPRSRHAFRNDVRTLLGDSSWLFFLIVMVVGGFFLAFELNYLFLYLEELGASETLMGTAVVLQTASEVPVWLLAPLLLRRWGARGLLTASLVAGLVQAAVYAFLPPGGLWLAMIVQLLHGPAFTAMWVAGVAFAAEMAPKGTQATAQGLFTGVKMGLGTALGAFIGGQLYEAVGGAAMFRWSIVTTVIALGLLWVSVRHRARTQQHV